MVKVSIIIPVYNTGKFLKRCIDSIINQTLDDIEIICVNDGSTDNSPGILEEYTDKDSRIKIINQENQGISCARNKGIECAEGEFIGFVDSDDWVDRDFFEKLYSAAQKYNADIAAGEIVQTNGIKFKKFLKFNSEKVFTNTNKKYKVCNIPRRCYVWNKIYKRIALDNCNIKFPSGRNFEDIVWTHAVVDKTRFLATVPDTCYYYYENTDSISKSFTKKNEEDLQLANKECMEYIRLNHIKVNYKHYSADKRILFKLLGIRFLDIKIWKHLILVHILSIPALQIYIK